MYELYPDGIGARRSTQFSVRVNGQSAFVYKSTFTTIANTTYAPVATALDVNYLAFGSDQVVHVEVTRIGVPITSARIYPAKSAKRMSYSISNGKLYLTLPANFKDQRPYLDIKINGVEADRLWLLVVKPQDPIPPGAIDMSAGIPPAILDGQTVFFPPGEYNVGLRYKVGNNCTVLIRGGAFVVGTFDTSTASSTINQANQLFKGPGVFSGEFLNPVVIQALPWEDAQKYAMFYGKLEHNGNITNCRVEDLIITRPCFYANINAICYWKNFLFINPWHWGIGGPGSHGDIVTGVNYIGDGAAWNSDDTFMWSNSIAQSTRERLYVATFNGQPFDLGFFSEGKFISRTWTLSPVRHILRDCSFRSTQTEANALIYLNLNGIGRFHCVFRQQIDDTFIYSQSIAEQLTAPVHDVEDIEIEDVCYAYPFVFETLAFDGVTPVGIYGRMGGHTFKNIRFTELMDPRFRGFFQGADTHNVPSNITFTNVWLGDRWLTQENFYMENRVTPNVYGMKVYVT